MALPFKTVQMSTRTVTIAAAAIGIPAIVALASPSSAHADFSVCNDTSTKVDVAYAYIDKVDGFVSRGWRTLNPGGDCDMMVSTSQTSDPTGYFYYAEAEDGSGVWEDMSRQELFCTVDSAFKIDKSAALGDECGQMGGEVHNFYWVEAPSGNATRHLSDGKTKFDE